mmetsp:Transcript_39814/g.93796  ORF Transcript_39814/g.93796 Transcript_39814/m.93796 type:complete len:318 (-) Transcript_39814:1315-2268(-)
MAMASSSFSISRSFFFTLSKFFSAKESGRHSTSAASSTCTSIASSTCFWSKASCGSGGCMEPLPPAAASLGGALGGGKPWVLGTAGLLAKGAAVAPCCTDEGGGNTGAEGFGFGLAFASKTADGAAPQATAACIFAGTPQVGALDSPTAESPGPPSEGNAVLERISGCCWFLLPLLTVPATTADMLVGAPTGAAVRWACVLYDAHPICKSLMDNLPELALSPALVFWEPSLPAGGSHKPRDSVPPSASAAAPSSSEPSWLACFRAASSFFLFAPRGSAPRGMLLVLAALEPWPFRRIRSCIRNCTKVIAGTSFVPGL